MLESRGLSPQKMFGQNFLIDHNLIRKLVDASNAAPGDIVLEVGPGTGVLTEALLDKGCTVIACDIDRGLCALLRDRLADRITLVEGDCLESKHALSSILSDALARHSISPTSSTRFRLVANLPYACATPLIMILLSQWPSCEGLFVTIQKEVADRLAAHHNTKHYGPISVLAQSVATVELFAKLPPHCFWPQPDVTSAMISLRRLPTPRTQDPEGLLRFCNRLFEQRRKQLGGVLSAIDAEGEMTLLHALKDTTRRAESMSIAELLELFSYVRWQQ